MGAVVVAVHWTFVPAAAGVGCVVTMSCSLYSRVVVGGGGGGASADTATTGNGGAGGVLSAPTA